MSLLIICEAGSERFISGIAEKLADKLKPYMWLTTTCFFKSQSDYSIKPMVSTIGKWSKNPKRTEGAHVAYFAPTERFLLLGR